LLGWLPEKMTQQTREGQTIQGFPGFLFSIDNQSNQEREEKRKQVTRGRTDTHPTENSVLALVAGVGCRAAGESSLSVRRLMKRSIVYVSKSVTSCAHIVISARETVCSRYAGKALLAAGGELPPWQDVTFRCHDFRVD